RISARHVTRTPWFTPGYAAPEVFIGEYSPATDRYAFGGIVYYALSGENPPPSPEQIRQAFGALPPLAAAPPERRERILAMFSVEPGERPGAGEWMRELRALAAGREAAPGPALGAPVPPPAPQAATGTVPEAAPLHAGAPETEPRPPAAPGAGSEGAAGGKGGGAQKAGLAGGAAAWALLGGQGETEAGGQAAEAPRDEPGLGGGASASDSPSADPSPSEKAEEEKEKDEDEKKEEDRVNERPGSPLSTRSTILPAQEYGSGEATLVGVRYQESLTVSGACGKPSAAYNLGRGSPSLGAPGADADDPACE